MPFFAGTLFAGPIFGPVVRDVASVEDIGKSQYEADEHTGWSVHHGEFVGMAVVRTFFMASSAGG